MLPGAKVLNNQRAARGRTMEQRSSEGLLCF